MTLHQYLKLKYILKEELDLNHQNIRETYKENPNKDIDKLYDFLQKSKKIIKLDFIDEISKKLNFFAISFILTMFLVGFVTGLGLLNYTNNASWVNIIWFFVTLIFFPFIIFIYKLITLFFKNHTTFLDSSLKSLLKKFDEYISVDIEVTKLIGSIIIQLAFIALFIGTLLSLFLTLLGTYISFGWQSTLLSVDTIQSTVNLISTPWSYIVPSGVPSLELIKSTNYSQISLDSKLLESSTFWWKFLALSLIVWGFIPRIVLFFVSYFTLSKILERSILNDEKVKIIREYMNEVYISTYDKKILQAQLKLELDKDIEVSKESYTKSDFDSIIGWNQNKNDLEALLNYKQLTAPTISIAGAIISSDELDKLCVSLEGKVLIMANSYEPPMKDFLYFIEDLLDNKVKDIVLYPVGVQSDDFTAKEDNINIWKNKLLTLKRDNVRIYNDS